MARTVEYNKYTRGFNIKWRCTLNSTYERIRILNNIQCNISRLNLSSVALYVIASLSCLVKYIKSTFSDTVYKV